MSPASGSSKPAMARRVVVLPHPDGPSSAINSPSWTSTWRSSTATTLPKRFVRPVSVMADIGAGRRSGRHLAVPAVDQLRLLVVDPKPVPLEDLWDVGLGDRHELFELVGHLHLRVGRQPEELAQPHFLRLSLEHPVHEGKGSGLVLRAPGDRHVLLEHDHALGRRHPADGCPDFWRRAAAGMSRMPISTSPWTSSFSMSPEKSVCLK